MATCSHLGSLTFRPPTSQTAVHKDECTRCFDNQDAPDGLDICLSCFNGGCTSPERQHAKQHWQQQSHPIVLNLKRTLVATSAPRAKMTKLTIDPEADKPQYDVAQSVVCRACDVALDASDARLAPVVAGVMQALSSSKQSDVKAWQHEIHPCPHSRDLPAETHERAPTAPPLVQCGQCDMTSNLWLCLVCGQVGCGRPQYGGGGGNGHGKAHYSDTQHPLCVKLGTILPEGTADVYCYQCDDEVQDPHLGARLARFGINIAHVERTEKTITELQLEQNLNFDFNMTTQDGHDLESVAGPGLTGIQNLGNSCYLSSCLQLLFNQPNWCEYFYGLSLTHADQCYQASPSDCFDCQMAKLTDGLLSGRYARTPTTPTNPTTAAPSEPSGIAPRGFKALIGNGHPEFSTMRQQDASEFMDFLLEQVRTRKRGDPDEPTPAFRFQMNERYACDACHGVLYLPQEHAALALPMVNPDGTPAANGGDGLAPLQLTDSLNHIFRAEARTFDCPACKSRQACQYRQGFATFPRVLFSPVFRFFQDNDWVIKKSTRELQVDLTFDAHGYEVVPQAGETELEAPPPNTAAATAADQPDVNAGFLAMLMEMGFGENRCRRALIATKNASPDVAMNWLMEHMEDADIDTPITAAGSTPAAAAVPSEEACKPLVEMGFTMAQARAALQSTGGRADAAVEWLFAHPDTTGLEPEFQAGAGAASSSPAKAVPGFKNRDGAPVTYRLTGFISHKGPSAHCGHYVAHVRKESGTWYLFNDEKVAKVPDALVPAAAAQASIYFYERV
ncbi:hypothetical protein CXG81DRAFT_10441 [Caulochytrium protostelioides]|uniref:Ubiquitin carboxyl-terminal hydrolase n=1 Tax=Caulochytrium protostelioides TaxID=1555241 RepID=A0A4V1IV43_9FUNG|nr:hypothetical protein CXG81DRAFT_10441 [Caulochytrium protostelioides]|eukprot:RKP02759.1 hypothetical protein CXG81DRAFT_10441 [Caulochytrium protostelioides]